MFEEVIVIHEESIDEILEMYEFLGKLLDEGEEDEDEVL